MTEATEAFRSSPVEGDIGEPGISVSLSGVTGCMLMTLLLFAGTLGGGEQKPDCTLNGDASDDDDDTWEFCGDGLLIGVVDATEVGINPRIDSV